MGKALKIELLKESEFSPKEPFGKALFRVSGAESVEQTDLIPSSFVDERIPYPVLNPLQSVFFRFYEKGNALVCSPTSSGKSLIAYLFMRKHKGRLVYTAPTKALVNEKAVEFRRFYGSSVEVRTGESILSAYKEVRARLVVSTYEHLAYAFRNSASWLESVSALVVDEVHQISKRWVLEEVITYCLDKGISLLGLSATLPGYERLAEWISADLVINSGWRPVPLVREYYKLLDFPPLREYEDREELIAQRLFSALWALKKPGEKVLVFVPKKSLGWKLLEVANKEKIGILNQTLPFEVEEGRQPEIAFHNADVPKEEREQIEKAFREGSLDVLVATQTLAYGVNLPADRAIILTLFYKDRKGYKVLPDSLDLLQMEGRVGRLGIKEVGYTDFLVYGAKDESLKKELECALEKPFTTATVQGENTFDALSFFVLLGYLYEGRQYRKYLEKTYFFRELKEVKLKEVEKFLKEKGYIKDNQLSQKGMFCVKSGIPPTRFEEFLRRLFIGLPPEVCVRPLLHIKRFDGLFEFLKRDKDFEEDKRLVQALLIPCGRACLEDNTDQFLFYLLGKTVKYPNLKNPPGEFSYLGTDALHLVRNLIDIRKHGFYPLSKEDILGLSHSVKYGIEPKFASLAGIKGIGHIRANLLKLTLEEAGFEPPTLGSPTANFLHLMEEEGLWEVFYEKLLTLRRYEKDKAKAELEKVKGILKNNAKGYMIDDRILLAYALFTMGNKALNLRKKELLEAVLWS
ncbi:MAG: DEAD/DEAH box helicase [Aquificota bacterium]|nr:MAG: DEAD/DEAH box helicase [Aquificota bacterium]